MTVLNKKGFTFVEVLVAVFVVSVGIVALVGTMPSIISDTSLNNSRLTAAYLAQEGIEIVRNIRDSNDLQGISWDTGLTGCSNGYEADYTDVSKQPAALSCYTTGKFLNIDSNGFYSYSAGTPTIYKRKISITEEGSADLKVTADVYWSSRGKTYHFLAEEKIYNWYSSY